MDRRRNLLVNVGEKEINELLLKSVKSFGGIIHQKIGLKDAVRIERSGLSNEDYSYALKAHLDFVVTNEDYEVEFAVEFDEAHHYYNKEAILRDRKKDYICERLGLPLIRIGHDCLNLIRELELVNWITELYFKYPENPEITPFDEAYAYFRYMIAKGYLLSEDRMSPDGVVLNFARLRFDAWAFVRDQSNHLLCASASFRSFPKFCHLYPSQIAVSLAVVALHRRVLSGEVNSTSFLSLDEFTKLITDRHIEAKNFEV